MKRFILASLMFFSACHKPKSEEVVTNSLKIDFQEGDLTSLHPHELIIYLRGISIGKTLFEGLTRIDESGKAILAGAKSVEISVDELQYTFKLRENRWSDGTIVTAKQYELGWKEALSPHSICKRSDLLYMIKNAVEAKKGDIPLDQIGVKAIDDETLFVELVRPSPHFLELLAQPITAPIQQKGKTEIQNFNGPFMVTEWKKNSQLILKPNPYFWNKDKINLPQIDVYMVQDPETTYALYEKNQLDWIGVPLAPLSIEQIDDLKRKKSLLSHPIERAFWIFLNTKHISLSSSSIRKALSLAISRETIAENVLVGGRPLDKPLPQELLPHQSKVAIREDLLEAKHLFALGLQELGIKKEDFPPLMISYSQQAGRKQLAEYLQQTWSQTFGIEVKLLAQDWNTLRANMNAGDFEITGAFEASYYHDPLELMERMGSLNAANFPQWDHPLYQQKIASAGKNGNNEERLKLLSEAEDILLDQMPFIPITSDRFLFTHHPKLKGYTFDSVGAIDFSYASMRE